MKKNKKIGLLLTPENVSEVLGVSVEEVLKACKERRLSHIAFPDGTVRFRREDVVEALEDISRMKKKVSGENPAILYAEKTLERYKAGEATKEEVVDAIAVMLDN